MTGGRGGEAELSRGPSGPPLEAAGAGNTEAQRAGVAA